MPIDLRLNAIVDPERAGGRDLAELARLCAAGGATLIQLRDKKSETRAMVEAARAIKQALAPFGVPFVVNDRIDVALAAEADGVHLGPDDMAVEDARRLLGPDALIGLSIKSVAEAEAAPVELIDYVGSGGVYVTLSKQQKNAPIGTEGLRAHRRGAAPPGARNCRSAGIAGIDAEQCRCGDRCRRRRRRRHLGAVACARSGRRGAHACAASSMRCWRNEAHDERSGRRDHRRLGFGRRRRHAGRSENLLRARRLWRVRHHRAYRAKHQRRFCHSRSAGGFHRRADRRGVFRSSTSAR